eukprot:c26261_g1_i1.p1 GENE.c26261_g1_i1~~c26261_g1_i1.p1  ORF type:complete len:476 (+),score=93.94 c26261_g1_i1:43-1470(+)
MFAQLQQLNAELLASIAQLKQSSAISLQMLDKTDQELREIVGAITRAESIAPAPLAFEPLSKPSFLAEIENLPQQIDNLILIYHARVSVRLLTDAIRNFSDFPGEWVMTLKVRTDPDSPTTCDRVIDTNEQIVLTPNGDRMIGSISRLRFLSVSKKHGGYFHLSAELVSPAEAIPFTSSSFARVKVTTKRRRERIPISEASLDEELGNLLNVGKEYSANFKELGCYTLKDVMKLPEQDVQLHEELRKVKRDRDKNFLVRVRELRSRAHFLLSSSPNEVSDSSNDSKRPRYRGVDALDSDVSDSTSDDEDTINRKQMAVKWLTAAVSRGNVEEVKAVAELMARSGFPLAVSDTYFNPFCVACCDGNLEIVQALLEVDPDLVNTTLPNNLTPLHVAVMSNHTDCALYLFDVQPSLITVETEGLTALELALANCQIKDFDWLVDSSSGQMDGSQWDRVVERAQATNNPQVFSFFGLRC